MKKRMQQLTTVNSTLIFKYTCSVCMCHEEIHEQKWDMYIHVYTYYTNMYVYHICKM